ncbi:MAG: LysE family transporter, partial [Paludibacteraceae bacterium]|nr:LysE family transporter [Paludibacteraceae bacterium]
VFIFMKNPSSDLKKSSNSTNNFWQDFVSAFALTVSNPMIMFLFLGVFARFNFLSSSAMWYEVLIGVGGVFCGAALWWFMLTTLASVFRNKFNIRGLWLLNKITGSVICILAIGSLVLSVTGYSINV